MAKLLANLRKPLNRLTGSAWPTERERAKGKATERMAQQHVYTWGEFCPRCGVLNEDKEELIKYVHRPEHAFDEEGVCTLCKEKMKPSTLHAECKGGFSS